MIGNNKKEDVFENYNIKCYIIKKYIKVEMEKS